MKKVLSQIIAKKLLLLGLFLLFSFVKVRAQFIVYGNPVYHTTFTFGINDSLQHNLYDSISSPANGTVLIDTSITDSTQTRLWQIGGTSKAFFTGSVDTIRGIMTDTAHYYPVNANSWFTLNIQPLSSFNLIVSFVHKYETATGRDGGIVEFSTDSGYSWNNIMGDCYSTSPYPGKVLTDNFYNKTDTLLTGQPAFSGTQNQWLTSSFQFFVALPVKTTGSTSCKFTFNSTYLVRFRFISDSTQDSLAGWIIKSIKIRQDLYSGAVPKLSNLKNLNIYPNPANGIFNFPTLTEEHTYTLEITNAMGQRIINIPYQHALNLTQYTKGIYFYKVTNGLENYYGKLLVQ